MGEPSDPNAPIPDRVYLVGEDWKVAKIRVDTHGREPVSTGEIFRCWPKVRWYSTI